MQYLSLIFSILLIIATYALHQERPEDDATGFIAFNSDRTGEPQIYAMWADGTIVKKVIHSLYNNAPLSWSHDSKWIYFSWSDPLYQASIFAERILPFQEGFPISLDSQLSPNTQWKLLRGLNNQQSDLYIYKTDGTYLKEIHKSVNLYGWLDNEYFYFSSEGGTYIASIDKKIVSYVPEFEGFVEYYDSSSNMIFISHLEREWFGERFYALYQLSIGSTEPELIVNEEILKDYRWYWIIDKQTILGERYDKNTNLSSLEFLNFTTKNVTTILSYDGHLRFSQFSPNLHWFLFEISDPSELHILDLTLYETYLLSQDLTYQANSSWSTDSQWIAFQTELDGNMEIFRVRPDGTDLTNLTHHPAKDTNPSWSPFVDDPWHPAHLMWGSLALIGLIIGIEFLTRSIKIVATPRA